MKQYSECQCLGMLGAHPNETMVLAQTLQAASGAPLWKATNDKSFLPPTDCQTEKVSPSSSFSMAFRNEVVSDADIDRYNLPFPKGGGRWWTRDAERDCYLWGGLVGNLAYQDKQEGIFHLLINGTQYRIKLLPGYLANETGEQAFNIHWEEILRIDPDVKTLSSMPLLISTLKEALRAYGCFGQELLGSQKYTVTFGF